MIVYRIQDRDGCGIYTADHGARALEQADYNEDDGVWRPLPYEDFGDDWSYFKIKNDEKDIRFGFSSIEQLLQWFPDWRVHKTLHDAGYRVYQIEVDESKVLYGKTQVAFIVPGLRGHINFSGRVREYWIEPNHIISIDNLPKVA